MAELSLKVPRAGSAKSVTVTWFALLFSPLFRLEKHVGQVVLGCFDFCGGKSVIGAGGEGSLERL